MKLATGFFAATIFLVWLVSDQRAAAQSSVNETAEQRDRILASQGTAPNEADYEAFDLPVPLPPSPERPYHYVRFDSDTLETHGGAPIDFRALHSGTYILVMNFVSEDDRFSEMQTKVIEQGLLRFAPESAEKPLMLVDVVVEDSAGQAVYAFDYAAMYEDNRIGPNGTQLSEMQVPYGAIIGHIGRAQGQVFSFALMNGVKTDADLRVNANAIYSMISTSITQHNLDVSAE